MKNILLIFILFGVLQAEEPKNKVFTAVIDVESTKTDGKPWDIAGGAPDIKLIVDGKELIFDKKCKNRYRCKITFISNASKWYLEVYDKDMRSSDLVGKGECSLRNSCTLELAKVKVIQK